MTAVLVGLWTFLNSPIGVGLLITGIGKLFAVSIKSDTRRAQILAYAETAFHVAESVGTQLGWTGQEKYLRYVENIVNSLKAAHQPELSAKEMVMLQELAAQRAVLAKGTVARPRVVLPLPAPPDPPLPR